jgi:putative hydroxymethylpyrimidine transporter CytX
MNSKIKNSSMLLLWMGASISLAEIWTGSLLAPLGFTKAFLSIIIGHLIGGLLLSFSGLISFTNKKNAMEVVRGTLGSYGVKLVAFLNVLQLLGWSAIMIIQGARGINTTLNISNSISILIMGIAVFVWCYLFNNNSKKVNDITVVLLLLIIAFSFFKLETTNALPFSGPISFITAIELSIAMPISWLPVIGDYTINSESKKGVFFSSFIGYFIGSSAMFLLGFLVTRYTNMDIIQFITSKGLPLVACAIVVLSTVTTTFLDVYSAVESSKQVFNFKNGNVLTGIYCFIGIAVAFVFPIENYQNFLLSIGSIFVPVYTIVFTEYLLKKNISYDKVNIAGITIAIAGIILSNILVKKEILMSTVITILIVSLCYALVSKIFKTSKTYNESI